MNIEMQIVLIIDVVDIGIGVINVSINGEELYWFLMYRSVNGVVGQILCGVSVVYIKVRSIQSQGDIGVCWVGDVIIDVLIGRQVIVVIIN